MAVEVIVKKWGNSVGIVLPKEMVKKEDIKENEKVLIEVVKEANLTKFFKSIQRKISGQEFKDLARGEWF